MKLNLTHYEKLKTLFMRHGSGSFEDALYCLLLRYHGFHGQGFQAALPVPVFRVLRERFGVCMEGFASPLNSYFSRFCAAYDADRMFGSIGSFFDWRPAEGSFEANPPFVDEIMEKAVIHCDTCLSSASSKSSALSLCMVFPHWPDATG